MALLYPEPVEARRRHVDSSEIAALFGLDERRSRFELWHQKAGNIPEPDLSDDQRVFWGTVLEPAVAQGVAELKGWKVRRVRRYVEHPSVPGMGTSLDFEVFGHPRGAAPLEIQNVDALAARYWPDGRPPLRFELQVQHQLACLPNRPWAALGVLIGGSPRVFEYDRQPRVIAEIEMAVAELWRSIEENRPPEPELERDLPALEALYSRVCPGTVQDLRGHRRLEELCAEYESARRDETAAEKRKRTAKAEILSIIRDTETVFCEGFKVLAPERQGGAVSYHRKPYRDFRVFRRGGGEASLPSVLHRP